MDTRHTVFHKDETRNLSSSRQVDLIAGTFGLPRMKGSRYLDLSLIIWQMTNPIVKEDLAAPSFGHIDSLSRISVRCLVKRVEQFPCLKRFVDGREMISLRMDYTWYSF